MVYPLHILIDYSYHAKNMEKIPFISNIGSYFHLLHYCIVVNPIDIMCIHVLCPQ